PVGPVVVMPVRKGPVTHAPAARVVSLGAAILVSGETQEIPVTLTASGEENALGFTVSYDPAVLKFIGAVKGTDGQKATLNVNTRQQAGGRAAVALTLSPAMQFPAGTLEVARLQLMTIGSGINTTTVSFTDAPVSNGVASSLATPLETAWQDASFGVALPTVNVRPIETSESSAIELSWPAALTEAVLETADNPVGANWTPGNFTPTVINGQNTVVVPLSGGAAYFHLKLP
ncbi:MAG TPA: cohesin domain-containing protein, partial [Candidatus Limnocylindria bacterium]|nr:cohesin domain-containing protein [Candidatus Limnocylindria bacterium]